jgi:hypothetical protein
VNATTTRPRFDFLKVATTIALLAVLIAAGATLFYRDFLASLPEPDRLIERPDDEMPYDPTIVPIPLVTTITTERPSP